MCFASVAGLTTSEPPLAQSVLETVDIKERMRKVVELLKKEVEYGHLQVSSCVCNVGAGPSLRCLAAGQDPSNHGGLYEQEPSPFCAFRSIEDD
jgi:hypothetical protein